MSERQRPHTKRLRVLEALELGPSKGLTFAQLRDVLGWGKLKLRDTLRALERADLVEPRAPVDFRGCQLTSWEGNPARLWRRKTPTS